MAHLVSGRRKGSPYSPGGAVSTAPAPSSRTGPAAPQRAVPERSDDGEHPPAPMTGAPARDEPTCITVLDGSHLVGTGRRPARPPRAQPPPSGPARRRSAARRSGGPRPVVAVGVDIAAPVASGRQAAARPRPAASPSPPPRQRGLQDRERPRRRSARPDRPRPRAAPSSWRRTGQHQGEVVATSGDHRADRVRGDDGVTAAIVTGRTVYAVVAPRPLVQGGGGQDPGQGRGDGGCPGRAGECSGLCYTSACSGGQGADHDHRVAEALQGDPLGGDRVGTGTAQLSTASRTWSSASATTSSASRRNRRHRCRWIK